MMHFQKGYLIIPNGKNKISSGSGVKANKKIYNGVRFGFSKINFPNPSMLLNTSEFLSSETFLAPYPTAYPVNSPNALPIPPTSVIPIISSQKPPKSKVSLIENPASRYLKRIELESENSTKGKGIGKPIDAEPKKHITKEINNAQR